MAGPGRSGTSVAGTPHDGFGAAAASLKRLRIVEYQNSVRDLLGASITPPADLDEDLARGGFTTISTAVDPYASAGIEKFEAAAYALSAQVFRSPTTTAALVGCIPSSTADPCIAEFVATFGRRAWRRPLSSDEVSTWTGVVSSVGKTFGGNVSKGLEYALAGLLQSPNFLYRVELGEPTPDNPGLRRYTAYEMATRLSYVFWQTTPDNALLDAAESGELLTDDGVGREVQRLLADPRSKPAMLRFFGEYFRLGDLNTQFHPKNAQLFPSMSDTLYASMRTEIEMNASEILENDQNVLDLLTARSTYVDPALAALYGIPSPGASRFSKVKLPAGRQGYLTSGAFLSINAHAEGTSPTRRGVYIVRNLLCREIPPPPADVNTSFPPATAGMTTRQQIEAHRSNPACAGCHAQFDPIGVAFEHFDAIGAYRATENGVTIDSSGSLNGKSFAEPEGLVTLLHDAPETTRCFVANAYRYHTAHNIVSEADGEGAVIDRLASDFAADGNNYKKLMMKLALSPAFRSAVGKY